MIDNIQLLSAEDNNLIYIDDKGVLFINDAKNALQTCLQKYGSKVVLYGTIDHRDMDGHPQQNTKETW